MEREQLNSRLGFILLSAGCAIGLGNVWKFPYIVGEYGGGLFVLFYVIFLLIIGAPILTMEYAMGRYSRKSPAMMYQEIKPNDTKWHYHGYAMMMGSYLLMMFYTVVAGWMVKYFFLSASGDLTGLDPVGIENAFDKMCADPVSMILITSIIIVIGTIICSFGIQKCLERVTKFMMLLLLVLMVVLAIKSLTLPGAGMGLDFYLKPDIGKFVEHGPINVIIAAMNQAFFTLSIGMGSMAIFGSYMDKKRSLLGEAITVGSLDLFVALMSGLIIFPACFTFGISVTAGPGLIFVTLPNVFNNMPFGTLWGSLFFLFMSFAALSTVLAVFECLIACMMDITGWTRKRCAITFGAMMVVLAMPCALGFNVLSGFEPLGPGTTILDLEDLIVSYLMLPLGALLFTIFCTTRYGWGWDGYKKEANIGKGPKLKEWMKPYITFVLPIMVSILFFTGLVTVFL